jgi:hypothetical protein
MDVTYKQWGVIGVEGMSIGEGRGRYHHEVATFFYNRVRFYLALMG